MWQRADRIGRADLPHRALGQEITPLPTVGRFLVEAVVRLRSTRRGEWIGPAPALPEFLLARPPLLRWSPRRLVAERAMPTSATFPLFLELQSEIVRRESLGAMDPTSAVGDPQAEARTDRDNSWHLEVDP